MDDLFYLEHCSSTNDELSSVLLYPESDFVAVYTFNQTKGRGQYGNSWNSAAGKNLAYSLAVKCTSVKVSDFLFNYYTAVLVHDFLANLTDKKVKIKWPNDIILHNKKVCGILLEKKKFNNQLYFVIGIGVNVLQEKFDEISNAGSILTQTSKVFDLKEFTENFHKFMTENLKSIPSENEILERFNYQLFKKDEISVFEKDGLRQNGIIRFADKNGEVHIEFEDGTQKFYHKEIKLLY
ncbi:biotin--[acetyl-CoA-carboxylase] ligase [Chryseobacterium sp.]|uniref:biotin--[acetyl-CoA-carboxylase] ligase n=1 Tax=Chryseobacterium sp. TaxID=1871047 RepID=UPI002898FDE7|nr:biotin--[acetyl-CoA-carboxylase] ligase [Chryseobacterium sp.]